MEGSGIKDLEPQPQKCYMSKTLTHENSTCCNLPPGLQKPLPFPLENRLATRVLSLLKSFWRRCRGHKQQEPDATWPFNIHTNIHTYRHTYIHTYNSYIHTYIHTHTHTHRHTHAHIQKTNTYTNIYIHIHIHTDRQTYIHVQYSTVHYITYITLHCTAFNDIAIHYITLHYIQAYILTNIT